MTDGTAPSERAREQLSRGASGRLHLVTARLELRLLRHSDLPALTAMLGDPVGMAAWLDFAFRQAGLDRIVSMIDAANTASIRVAEKIGMTLERTAVWAAQPRLMYSLGAVRSTEQSHWAEEHTGSILVQ